MANLPSNQSSSMLPEVQIESLIEKLALGKRPQEIANALHPTSKRRARETRKLIEHNIQTDPRIYTRIVDSAKTELVVGLVPAMKALAGRAAKGNVPAQKLLLEVSGVHNPRIKHEHKGDIKISVDLPRPKFDEES